MIMMVMHVMLKCRQYNHPVKQHIFKNPSARRRSPQPHNAHSCVASTDFVEHDLWGVFHLSKWVHISHLRKKKLGLACFRWATWIFRCFTYAWIGHYGDNDDDWHVEVKRDHYYNLRKIYAYKPLLSYFIEFSKDLFQRRWNFFSMWFFLIKHPICYNCFTSIFLSSLDLSVSSWRHIGRLESERWKKLICYSLNIRSSEEMSMKEDKKAFQMNWEHWFAPLGMEFRILS